MIDSNFWINQQWPSFAFFDPRLHNRAINIASSMLKLPTASIPERFQLQKEIKGCYRFLNNKTISHQMLQSQHYKNVLTEAASVSGRVLFIQDGQLWEIEELIFFHLLNHFLQDGTALCDQNMIVISWSTVKQRV